MRSNPPRIREYVRELQFPVQEPLPLRHLADQPQTLAPLDQRFQVHLSVVFQNFKLLLVADFRRRTALPAQGASVRRPRTVPSRIADSSNRNWSRVGSRSGFSIGQNHRAHQ